MAISRMVERRSVLKMAAAFGGLTTLAAVAPGVSEAQESEIPAAASPEVRLEDVQAGPNIKLSIERRGQIVLFGINRPYIQNRIDPETFEKLAEAYYQYDHDPSLRAAILFGHGENFSRGIDVEGFSSLAGTGKPWIASTGTIDPLAKLAPRLTKPLIVVTHGDTWNMAHEFHLVADIRIDLFVQSSASAPREPWSGTALTFLSGGERRTVFRRSGAGGHPHWWLRLV
jgi:enoyl-CoA hydratase